MIGPHNLTDTVLQGAAPLHLAPNRLTGVQWGVCVAAGVGFLFDLYEILVQSVVVRPALMDLAGVQPGSREFNRWVGWLLYLPFLAGGVCGLVGGYLTDLLGRRRVLVWSIVLYGVGACGAAFAASPTALLLWRCVTIVGVCVEWIAALAWIAEVFPDNRRRREAALGLTQVCGSFGAFLVGGVYYLSVTYATELPAILGEHSAWRYSLLFGALPVLPILILRLFLPESPRWREKKLAGTLRRPSFRELFRPELRRTTIVVCMVTACIYGTAFAGMQQIPRIVPGLSDVQHLPRMQLEQTIGLVQLSQDFGHLAGRLALAVLAMTLMSRVRLLRLFQVPALVLFPLVFVFAPSMNVYVFALGALLLGVLSNAQISFIGNYLPQAYPLHLRGTGESFALCVGGRIVGTSAAVVTAHLANFTPGANASEQLAFAAALVCFCIWSAALIVGRWLPEPARGSHNDE